MYNIITAEILKLKGSKMLWMVAFISFIPAPIKLIQHFIGKGPGTADWNSFISTGQELAVFGMLTSIILVSCFIFTMEYQYNTVSYIFTAPVSKVKMLAAKILALLLIITFSYLVSGISNIIFGYAVIREMIPFKTAYLYFQATVGSILIYFSLTALIAAINIAFKRLAISVTLLMGYLMLFFPFHLKGNVLINPFMIPTVVASKIFGSTGYIFKDYYKDITVNYMEIAGLLTVIFIIPFITSMLYYKKSDVF